METPRYINLLFIVLSFSIYFAHGFPEDDNVTSLTSLEKLIDANNKFAIKLHQSLALNTWRNIFLSPTSLFSALGILYVGAQGETAQELRDVLGYNEAGLSDEEVNDSFNQLLTEIFNFSGDFTLKTANAILLDHLLNLTPEFNQTMAFYRTNLIKVNFQQNTNQIVQLINRWISNQTDGRIYPFLEGLNRNTVMMILNAVYFKGFWSIPFKQEDTQRERFYNYGGTQKSKVVDMMHTSHKILYTTAPDWQMVELPYKGDRISMVIILPKQPDGLAAVENSITPDQILHYRNKLRMSTVNITLPKFKIDSTNTLKDNLASLGLQNMFLNGANFSGMVENGAVRVSNVLQKAMVEVNEEGTVAAAATGVYLVPLSLSLPRIFRVDHPFLFTIMDKKTNLILFSGRVIRL